MTEEQNQEEPKEQNQEEPQQPAQTPSSKSGSGLDKNIAGLLCYSLGPITGVIFLLIEKDNKFVKFHAIQSIIFSLAVFVINFIFTAVLFGSIFSGGFAMLGLISTGLIVLYVVLWIMLMYKAYNNEEWELPIIGSIAKNAVNK